MTTDVFGIAHNATGKTLYAHIRDRDGKIYDTTLTTYVTYATANIANYDVAMTEQGTASRFYTATFPGSIEGMYSVCAYEQAGGSPAEGDTYAGGAVIEWNGTLINSVIANGVDVALVANSTAAATSLSRMARSLVTSTVIADGSNTATTFKTNLSETQTDYYGDSNGGNVLAFIEGANNVGQTRRITAYNGTTKFVTVESAFDATPTASDEFILLGRIEA